jgi:hypothetical protein
MEVTGASRPGNIIPEGKASGTNKCETKWNPQPRWRLQRKFKIFLPLPEVEGYPVS